MNEAEIARLDRLLGEWRQGDTTLQPGEFVHIADCQSPLTEEAERLSEVARRNGNADAIGEVITAVPGFAVLTQTCDLVLSCRKLPFVEIAPLIRVDNSVLAEAAKALLIRKAYIPGIADQNLVADLERTMTIEKAILANWPRIIGCSTDAEARAFAGALARKRARAAFPDDFVAAIRPVQRRIRERHGRNSDEGQLLRHLLEIRVLPVPSWDAEEVIVRFLFIKREDPEGLSAAWHDFAEELIGRINHTIRFRIDQPEVARLEDFSAKDYFDSDRLDLDHLSDD